MPDAQALTLRALNPRLNDRLHQQRFTGEVIAGRTAARVAAVIWILIGRPPCGLAY